MYKNKTFLAVIPARGGSKRLPRKNVLDLAGKPLIAWTIEASRHSSYIDKTLVSSDDDEILSIAEAYSADILRRPSELASDTSSSFDAIRHAIESSAQQYDYLVLLQPTSPLRDKNNINATIELLEQKKADAIISVCEMEHSPLWANTLPNDGAMDNFLRNELINQRSQDLPKHYRLNGAIYICKIDRLLEEGSFFIKDNIFSYIMETEKSIDIDSSSDFSFAQWKMENRAL
jgi:CMP-N-acetylneuraminic acid synthetase